MYWIQISLSDTWLASIFIHFTDGFHVHVDMHAGDWTQGFALLLYPLSSTPSPLFSLSILWSTKGFNFDKVQCIYIFFPLVDCSFGVVPKKTLPDPRSQKFSTIFSSKCVIVHFCVKCKFEGLCLNSLCFCLWMSSYSGVVCWQVDSLLNWINTFIENQMSFRDYFWTSVLFCWSTCLS